MAQFNFYRLFVVSIFSCIFWAHLLVFSLSAIYNQVTSIVVNCFKYLWYLIRPGPIL